MQGNVSETPGGSLLSRWIRLTSPDPTSFTGKRTSLWREEVVSLLLPLTMVLALVGLLTSLTEPIRVVILGITIVCCVGALLFKRLGKTHLTGIIIIITVELSLFAIVLTAGGGHPDIEDVPLMDHLLISVVIAMAFFTPMVGLLIGVMNCLFMFMVFQYYPHGDDLIHHLSETYWSIVLPPLILHLFITGVFFIIMSALIKAIQRADQAEELARLRQSELELRKQDLERSEQLEKGTQAILHTLQTATTQADFSQRVPLTQDNLLWRVAHSINSLLTRLQGLKQQQVEMEKTRMVAAQLTECIKKEQFYPLKEWTGTMLDPLILAFHQHLAKFTKQSDQSPPSLSNNQPSRGNSGTFDRKKGLSQW
jgi:hypothetical protein